MLGSSDLPEGQPQCKSPPLRKDIQDVALKESRTVCACVCVSERERERKRARGQEECSTRMHAYVLALMCVYACVCGPLCEVENYF